MVAGCWSWSKLKHWGVALPLLLLLGCGSATLEPPAPPTTPPPVVPAPIGTHLILGNPSSATTSTSNPDNYLLVKPQYVLSYNNTRRIPNWVSWQLNQTWLGDTQRRNNFRPDTTLPTGWYQVRPNDYSGSGYDKGHMAPSGDRTANATDNSATFVMTNMVPQAPDNNQGPWAELEDYCRDLLQQGKELYITAGTYGQKGVLAKGQVSIPATTWKVIAVLDRPGLGIPGVTASTRIIAVEMPNEQGIRDKDWRNYRVSVDQLEKKTSYDFFNSVPRNIQGTIERKVDQQ